MKRYSVVAAVLIGLILPTLGFARDEYDDRRECEMAEIANWKVPSGTMGTLQKYIETICRMEDVKRHCINRYMGTWGFSSDDYYEKMKRAEGLCRGRY